MTEDIYKDVQCLVNEENDDEDIEVKTDSAEEVIEVSDGEEQPETQKLEVNMTSLNSNHPLMQRLKNQSRNDRITRKILREMSTIQPNAPKKRRRSQKPVRLCKLEADAWTFHRTRKEYDFHG